MDARRRYSRDFLGPTRDVAGCVTTCHPNRSSLAYANSGTWCVYSAYATSTVHGEMPRAARYAAHVRVHGSLGEGAVAVAQIWSIVLFRRRAP
ncbi:MAG: hypothetical protein H0X25_06735 [Acidobacteriales bacterium]|nr:hypothetical protein [Terriglobales bacterium]